MFVQVQDPPSLMKGNEDNLTAILTDWLDTESPNH